MTGSIYDWTIAPDANGTNDGDINWAEFQDPATVNNSARRMMGRLAEYLDDLAPIRTSTGASNVYQVTMASSPVTVTLPDGYMGSFIPHQTNVAGGCTLYVNGFAGVALRGQTGVVMPANAIQAGVPVTFYYKASTNEALLVNCGAGVNGWLQNFQSTDLTARILKVGTILPWGGTTLPGGYLYAAGQAVSRTTYAELFAAYGTTYGAGDGSTTFNLPDYRGRSLFGRDDMGGSAAGRLTSSGSGISGTALSAAGGFEYFMLARSALPNATLSYSGTTSTNGAHAHTTNVPGDTSTGGGSGISHTGNAVNNYGYGSDVQGNHAHTYSGNTSSINGGVTQTAINNMPPAAVCNWIIFASPPLAAAGALGTNGLQYVFDTGTTDADPGPGKMRFDNASQGSAAYIYISKTDAVGATQTQAIANAFGSASSTKGTILINKVGGQQNSFACLVTAIDTSPTNYVRLTLQSPAINGSFSSGDSIGLQMSRAGDPGSTGSKGAIMLANGLNSNIANSGATSDRITGPSSVFSVGGFTGGIDGQLKRIYNTTSNAMTIVNEDTSSTAANRIKTLTGANVTLRSGTSFASFEYDGTDQRWILMSTN